MYWFSCNLITTSLLLSNFVFLLFYKKNTKFCILMRLKIFLLIGFPKNFASAIFKLHFDKFVIILVSNNHSEKVLSIPPKNGRERSSDACSLSCKARIPLKREPHSSSSWFAAVFLDSSRDLGHTLQK